MKSIREIESKLNIYLPSDYVNLLLNFPDEIISAELNFENLLDNSNRIIEINLLLRKMEVPEGYLAIGYDVTATHFFIKLDDEDQAVYEYNIAEIAFENYEEDDDENYIFENLIKRRYKNLEEYVDELKSWV
ncbi:SMI1/KNR4 family protein [Aureibacter tunicatorum]|uniref:Knr4/Smi1-like domain-containing protein n=1 Tax=Aureibacter tunicatorum TaxID=866807 RepID=A0AAE3XQI7_9BACT|nr:SMI1/KNR4 family protein [Aureibacter tunicatorum]MDR6240076.1 hypothetical protein [Aureibacter tunicatorum]BDD04547.1 hypothetical protein AUTU_20300 [Aureibacter tunicatorum]